MEQIDLSSFEVQIPHSYPSVPSGAPNLPPPEARWGHSTRAAWDLFPVVKTDTHSSRCALLALPLEVRELILSYALPHTMLRQRREGGPGHDVVWRLGSTAILAANRQLHNEGAEIMYGRSTFDIGVLYNSIKFDFKRLLPSGLVPKQTPKFLDVVRERYLHLVRKVRITITIEDDYTGTSYQRR